MKVLVSVFALLFSTSAFAQSNWNHNGSVVTLHANGANRQFSYSVPRAGLPVTSGTVLFKGTKSGGTYSGTAYAFSSRCGTAGYQVSGPISNDDQTVTMYGKIPRRDASCRIVQYDDDTLVFNFQDVERTAGVSSHHNVTICVNPVFAEESKLRAQIDGTPATTERVASAINYLRAKYCREVPAQEFPVRSVSNNGEHVWDNCFQRTGQFRGERVFFVQCHE